jgi:hypothetical protein
MLYIYIYIYIYSVHTRTTRVTQFIAAIGSRTPYAPKSARFTRSEVNALLAYHRRRRMQPLRQRIIDSTGAHPLHAYTPVARAPTHTLAATSGSRIHATGKRASAFPTL